MKTLNRLLKAPMVQWSNNADQLTDIERSSIEKEADELAVRAARFAAYMSTKSATTHHDAAVKQQNRVAAKLRKALGYSYSKHDITF